MFIVVCCSTSGRTISQSVQDKLCSLSFVAVPQVGRSHGQSRTNYVHCRLLQNVKQGDFEVNPLQMMITNMLLQEDLEISPELTMVVAVCCSTPCKTTSGSVSSRQTMT